MTLGSIDSVISFFFSHGLTGSVKYKALSWPTTWFTSRRPSPPEMRHHIANLVELAHRGIPPEASAAIPQVPPLRQRTMRGSGSLEERAAVSMFIVRVGGQYCVASV